MRSIYFKNGEREMRNEEDEQNERNAERGVDAGRDPDSCSDGLLRNGASGHREIGGSDEERRPAIAASPRRLRDFHPAG
jgi:hypothetical protein